MRLLKSILAFAVLLMVSPLCSAQKQSNWDEALDRYELICERCLELRAGQASGEKVDRESMLSLLGQLSTLKRTLDDARGQMSSAQKARFEMIRRRFAGQDYASSMPAVEATAPKERRTAASRKAEASKPTPLETVQEQENIRSLGDSIIEVHAPVVRAETGADAHALSMQPDHFVTEAVRDETEKLRPFEYHERPTRFIGIQAGLSGHLSAGLTAGSTGQRWGAYSSVRMSIPAGSESASYDCDSNGLIPGGGTIWSVGESRKIRFSVTGGILAKAGNRAVIYGGAGYGSYSYMVLDMDGRWARVSDISGKGFSIETGVIFELWKDFGAGAGICCTLPGYAEGTVSLVFYF